MSLCNIEIASEFVQFQIELTNEHEYLHKNIHCLLMKKCKCATLRRFNYFTNKLRIVIKITVIVKFEKK